MEIWYRKIEERLKAGELALDLTIEKFEKVLSGDIELRLYSYHCPLCIEVDLTTGDFLCGGCPVNDAGELCGNPQGLYRQLKDAKERARVDEAGIAHRDDLIRNTILPFLEGLRQ